MKVGIPISRLLKEKETLSDFDKELCAKIRKRHDDEIEAQMEAPATQIKLKDQIRKAYADALSSPDFQTELSRLLNVQKTRLKTYVLEQVAETSARLEEVV